MSPLSYESPPCINSTMTQISAFLRNSSVTLSLHTATPRIAQQRQGKAGSGGGGRRLAEHLQISVRALVGGELL